MPSKVGKPLQVIIDVSIAYRRFQHYQNCSNFAALYIGDFTLGRANVNIGM
ncbi:hypothetical protein O9993_16945 [Vibrio lentus]|nr:hypothetical protein [Vibrio lentus]